MENSPKNWKKLFTQTTITSYFLGFVVIWFGVNEIFFPTNWVGFAPSFLGYGSLALSLVVGHGLILTLAGIMLVLGFYRRLAALVLAIIFLEIIVDLLIGQIAGDIIVRDIGLWGMSLALLFPSKVSTAASS